MRGDRTASAPPEALAAAESDFHRATSADINNIRLKSSNAKCPPGEGVNLVVHRFGKVSEKIGNKFRTDFDNLGGIY